MHFYKQGQLTISVFTMNQHLLTHVPTIIEKYGPPRAYSTRSLERAIGEISHNVHSKSTPGTATGNVLLLLACLRWVNEAVSNFMCVKEHLKDVS